MNAGRFLSREEGAAVEKAIAEAESRTSAEIVCAIASESGRYDRAESIAGLIVGVIALSIVYVAGTEVLIPSNSWAPAKNPALEVLIFATVLGFIAGSGLATYFHPLRRIFVGKREIEEEVRRSAAYVFAFSKISGARGRSGVLIYVSLFERTVTVLADEKSAEVLGERGLEELRDNAVNYLREKKRGDTFIETIRMAAERLNATLPPGGDNPDELPNRLLIFHPRP